MGRQAQILIIDDEPAIRRSLRAFLCDQGYDADGACSAEQAMALMEGRSYDLLIVDLRLPGMSGEQLIRQVHDRAGPARFLIHTGSMDFRLSEELRRLGLRDRHIFAKPVLDLQQLLTGIEERLALPG